MQAKKIIAADMRRALIKVRNELGPDAIILANRKVPNGVELIATNDSQVHVAQVLQHKQEADSTPAQWAQTDISKANAQAQQRSAEHKAQLAMRMTQAKTEAKKLQQNTSAQNETQSTPVVAPVKASVAQAQAQELKHLHQEIELLKGLLHSQSNWLNWGQFNYTQPIRAFLFQQFCRMGLSASLIKNLVGQAAYQQLNDTKVAWQQAMHTLAMKIPMMSEALIDAQGVIALVGPTGSGKTTTIAKIAASHVKKYGNQQLGLITTDAFRLGAQHQLDTLGKLLNVPVLVARSAQSLQKSLSQLSHKKLILIDTAGLTQRDPAWQIQLHSLQQSSAQMRCFLTIATTSQWSVLQQSAQDFASLQLQGSLLTKLDESGSLGPAISVIVEQQLPLSYVTCGLAIPDDMLQMDAMTLLKQAVRFGKEAAAIEEPEAMWLWEQAFVSANHSSADLPNLMSMDDKQQPLAMAV
jgi:flagellar biosynthesis protein FlhF